MKKFLKLLFRINIGNNDPKSNFVQVVVFCPLFLLLVFIWQKYGITSFIIGFTLLAVLTLTGYVWSKT